MKHFRLETRDDPTVPAELATAIAAVTELRSAHGTFEQRINDQLAALTARLDEREVRSQRPGVQTTAEQSEEVRAFHTYLRTGRMDERALNSSQAETGGVLAPAQISTAIISRVVQFSPIRALATVLPMGKGAVQLPELTEEVTVGPTGVPEVHDESETEPKFGLINLSVYDLPATIPVSRNLLADSEVDLSSYLAAHVGMKFGQRESTWFLKGTGLQNTPLGIMNDPRVTSTVAAGASLTADDVVDLYHAVPSAYAVNGAFLANRKTMAALRKLKDTTGQYLFQPALSAGTPPTLHGRPLLEAPELDDPTTGNSPLLFGDFASGYTIGDRQSLETLVDNITGYRKGLVYLNFTRRVGGVVTLGEAIAKLTLQ